MSTFNKPSNVKYTDMSIYIDEHIYTDDFDEQLVYEYLYHLINMLAHQGAYFKNAKYYDDFALNGATRVFLRLRNSKQFEYDENGNPQMEHVKSVLNYIKSIMYPMKVQFEQENYAQTKAYSKTDESVGFEIENNFRQTLEETIDELDLVEFNVYMQDISKTARAFIEQIPHSKHDAEWLNIYTSVMLSFLNSITFNNKNKEKLRVMKQIIFNKPEIIDKIYKEERQNCVILYHLDEKYRGYITVLLNRLRHLVAKDLSSTAKTYIPSEINAKNLLMASLDEEEFDLS